MRALVCVMVGASIVGGCAHHDTVAAGEALTVGDGRTATALVLELAHGSGSSNAHGSSFVEGRGRVLVGPTRQQLGGVLGVSRLVWAGESAPLWGGIGIGPGIEHTSSSVLVEGLFQARLGTGFVLGQAVEPALELSGSSAPAVLEVAAPSTTAIVRRRLLFTIGIAGDVDVRFTREPLFIGALMIGLSRVEEVRRSP